MSESARSETGLGSLPSKVGEQELATVARSVARRLRELAAIGRDPAGGWSRLGFGQEERRAHTLFDRWANELGLRVRQDAVGNSYAERAGEGSALMTGSHLDTVPRGGNFDGAAGVVAALEAAALLREVPLRHHLTVVAFSCEEGARFTSPCLGSRVATGTLPWARLGQMRDANGVTALEAANSVGLRPEAIEPWVPGAVGCYLELHIEQGRVLQESDRRIGIVDTIAGSTRLEITVRGRSDHSGTTPMRMRQDALIGAAEVVTATEQVARSSRTAVATVGRLQVSPNVVTTVPGEVRFTIDVRDIDPLRQRELAGQLLRQVGQVAVRRNLKVSATLLHDQSPSLLPHWLRVQLSESAEAAGIAYRVLPSGAGHDAGYISMVAPAGMLFVPSREGVSHAPEEWSAVEDIALGAALLARALVRVDSGPRPLS